MLKNMFYDMNNDIRQMLEDHTQAIMSRQQKIAQIHANIRNGVVREFHKTAEITHSQKDVYEAQRDKIRSDRKARRKPQ